MLPKNHFGSWTSTTSQNPIAAPKIAPSAKRMKVAKLEKRKSEPSVLSVALVDSEA